MVYEQLKELTPSAFKRYCGVKPQTFAAMLEVLKAREGRKKRPGRPPKLALEDQLLLTLQYWREYRTLFHIATSYRLHESTTARIVKRTEDVLVASEKFKLPKKRELTSDHELVVVIVDSTETPIERPKKSSNATSAARRNDTA